MVVGNFFFILKRKMTQQAKNFFQRLPTGQRVFRYRRPFNEMPVVGQETIPQQFRTALTQMRSFADAQDTIQSRRHRLPEELVSFLYHWVYKDADPNTVRERMKVLLLFWKHYDSFYPNLLTRHAGEQKSRQVGGKILRLSSTIPGAFVITENNDHKLYIIKNAGVVYDGNRFLDLSTLIPEVFTTGNDCPICLQELTVGQGGQREVMTLACNHRFHMGCHTTFLRTSRGRQCPMCRTRIMQTSQFPAGEIRTYRRRR